MNILKDVEQKAKDKNLPYEDWLDDLTFSEAFVVCIGAGPWKLIRRQKIQQQALDWLNARDLSELSYCDIYPLKWQNDAINNCILYLKLHKISFEDYCKSVSNISSFYNDMGNPKGIKVLSLFARDKLEIPSFPMDRHVKKYLKAYNLPLEENKLVDYCLNNNLDTRLIATYMVKFFNNEPTTMVNKKYASKKS